MTDEEIQADLNWLVDNPGRTQMATYHDAGQCWRLIEAAVEEIRKLRQQLASRPDRPGGEQ